MSISSIATGRRWARRLPPVLQAGAGLALLLAVFPSALHIPITGPGGQAQVAPVPGKSEQSSISLVGTASSEGAGSGGASASANGSVADLQGNVTVPSLYNCVGDPPRQTPDPLSPPCVSGWKGNNGGATWRGVGPSTLKVTLLMNAGTDGTDFTTSSVAATDSPATRTIKTLLRYFQSRFETYGRTIDLVEQKASGGGDASGGLKTAQSGSFASVVVEPGNNTEAYLTQTANAEVPAFLGWWSALSAGPSTDTAGGAFLATHAPYVYTFAPDLDDRESATAQWICRELAGRPAIHAGDATLRGTTRKFGMVYDPSQSGNGSAGPKLLEQDLKQACGIDLGTDALIVKDDGTGTADSAATARLQADGVTSVLTEMDPGGMTQAADEAVPRYAPEWIFNDDSDASYELGARNQQQDQWSAAFGITWRWRIPILPQTYWDQAYATTNADGQFDTWYGPQIYELLMQLFSAVQMAGPALTPSKVAAGLESYSRVSPGDWSPNAGYSPGAYDFLKDAALVRWNATGQPPGGADPGTPGFTGAPAGCYEFLDTRTIGGQWPAKDQAGDSGPCTADWERLSELAADSYGN